MSDGTFAVLGLLLGLWQMGAEHCPAGDCLAARAVPGAASLSSGMVWFQGEAAGRETYLRATTGRARGPFLGVAGASATRHGDLWAGAGAAVRFGDPLGLLHGELHLMPGLWRRGRGPDLGGAIEFRSGAELGVAAGPVEIGLSYDHRSNGGLFPENPGLESFQLRVRRGAGARR